MRQRRALVGIIVAIAVAWIAAGTVYGITHGRPDGDDHPYVGILIFYAPDSTGADVPQWYCTGALIAPTVVLTAGHCTDGASFAMVSFNSDITNPPWSQGAIKGEAHTHPDFSWDWRQGLLGWNAVDTGVVVLETPVTDKGFAMLPDVGFVDALKMGTPIDVVGYGVQFKQQVSGPPYYRWDWTGQRYFASTQIVASNNRNSDMWLKLAANPGQGKGGICFGDSGGPDLLAGTNIILATNSFVPNTNCAGLDYSNRIDRAVVLDWLRQYLPPEP